MYYNEYWIDRSFIVFDHISVSIIHKAFYNLDFVSEVSFYIMVLKESGQSPEGMFFCQYSPQVELYFLVISLTLQL
jgi:hypothetical protein